MTLPGKVCSVLVLPLVLALPSLVTAACTNPPILSPKATPTLSNTRVPSLSPTAMATPSLEPTLTATRSPRPTSKPEPRLTISPMTTLTPTLTTAPTPLPKAITVLIPSPTSAHIPTQTPTATATATATATPTPTPTLTPDKAAHAALSQLLPWYGDPPFPLAVVPIIEVWLKDAELGMELASAGWLHDGLGPLESDAVYGLSHIHDLDPAVARRVLAHSAEQPVRTLNVHALGALGAMAWQHPTAFQQLVAREWFADGLSPEERAFVIVLAKIVGDDALYADLLEERFTVTTTIELPLSGEVGLWAFGHDAVEGDVLSAMEAGARAAERVMGGPFPVTDIILLQVNAGKYGYGFGGANFRDSMVLSIDSHWEEFAHADLLYHEVAHYHLAFEAGPHWLVEGGADFVRAYRQAWDGTEDWHGQVPLFEGNKFAGKVWCVTNGVATIAALGEPSEFQDPCGYALGQYFLTHLYNAIGLDAFSSAMREIYERYLDYQYHPTEEQVYRIFLKHTPPDREAAYQDLYRRLHGGPFLDGE